MDIESIWQHIIFIWNKKYRKFGNIEVIGSVDNYFIVKVWNKQPIQFKIEINYSFLTDNKIEISEISPSNIDSQNLIKILTTEVRNNRLKLLNI